jgi:predicted MFS family arabinose efflux permease
VVLGLTRSYLVAFVALLVLSAADMVSVFIRGSLVPLVTPDEKRGRVMAVENVFIGASNELGAFESGMVGQALGVPAAVIGGGVATIAVVGVWWFGFPMLRDVDRLDELGH